MIAIVDFGCHDGIENIILAANSVSAAGTSTTRLAAVVVVDDPRFELRGNRA